MSAGCFRRLAAALAAVVAITAAVPVLAAAEDVPKIAVYVTGARDVDESSVLTTLILEALIKSGKYSPVERSDEFVAQIDREMKKQTSGAVDESQISAIGKQAGVKFVCVVSLARAFGSAMLSARIINVETAMVETMGSAESRLSSINEIKGVSNEIVRKMLGPQTEEPSSSQSIITLTPPTERTPPVSTYTPPAPARTYTPPPPPPPPPPKVKKEPAGHSMGLRVDFTNMVLPEVFMRVVMDTHNRLYLGVKYSFGTDKVLVDGVNSGLECKWSDIGAAAFFEWQTNGKVLNIYGGPGGAAGYYSGTNYYGSMALYDESAFWVNVGGQGGAEVKFGSLVFGADVSPMYSMHFYEETKSEFGVSIGIHLGFRF